MPVLSRWWHWWGLCWIARCFLARQNPIVWLLRQPLVLAWILWYLSIQVSLAWNGAGSKGWAHDIVIIRYVIFGLAMIDISRRRPVSRYLLTGLSAGVIWAALNTASAYILGYDFLGKPLYRYAGKLKEASRIAGMVAYAAPFFMAWGGLDKKLSAKGKAIVIGFGVIAFVLLIQAKVRTAVIAASVGILWGMVFYVRRNVSLKFMGVLISGVVLAAGLFFYYGEGFNLNSMYDRIYFWKVAWRIWLEHPLLGVGISSFQDAYKEMALSGQVDKVVAPNGIVYQTSEATHAHNLFFMLAASTGLLGLLSFGWLMVQAIRKIFKQSVGFCLGLLTWPVVLLVVGLTGFNIYHSWYQALLAFWLALIAIGHQAGTDDPSMQSPFVYGEER